MQNKLPMAVSHCAQNLLHGSCQGLDNGMGPVLWDYPFTVETVSSTLHANTLPSSIG